jgi:hypothetical protein
MPLSSCLLTSPKAHIPDQVDQRPRANSESVHLHSVIPPSTPTGDHGILQSGSSHRTSRLLCAMMNSSDGPSRAAPLSPPASSPIVAQPTRRINPGVYICKGEGHSLRHSWIVGGRLVEFPFPESHTHDDLYSRKHHVEEDTRPPIPIPTGVSRRPGESSSNGSASH